MKEIFFKFPSTPHLAVIGNIDIRSDKVLSAAERDEFLRHHIAVEEKVDGANLGISFNEDGNICAQNRGQFLHLPESGQWNKLNEWLTSRTDILFENLTDRYILFGEWTYAQHSVFYDRLPDWFLGFDVYDRISGHFFSCPRRDEFLKKMEIAKVPTIARGHFALNDLEKLLSHSKLGPQPAEGLYLRIDEGRWLLKKAKLVRPEFIQSLETHWSRSAIRQNLLAEKNWNERFHG